MADLAWLRYHSPESGAERRSDLHFSGKISAIRSKHQFFIDKSYSLLLSNNSSFVPNKLSRRRKGKRNAYSHQLHSLLVLLSDRCFFFCWLRRRRRGWR